MSPRGNGPGAIEQHLRAASVALLARAGDASAARLEAELLMAHALGVERARLLLLRDVPGDAEERFVAAVRERLATGRPVAYLVGHREFLDLDLLVDGRVLVPRPETETVAEVLDELLSGGALPAGAIADRGTGSGNLALAVRGRRPVLAIDVSADALAVARANFARLLPQAPILPVRADGLLAVRPASLAAVLANPPYVEAHEFEHLPEDVRGHEPRGALVPGEGSVRAMFARLLAEAAAALLPRGWLVTEVGAGQAGLVAELASVSGFGWVEVREDLAGVERVVAARR